ncbi:choice-of-anchor D domain-containing protein [Corallococcus sp. BB11-1]|uniref:choice-of-anchor D domain-containing protein n=1 Tax=Corallococcus sp. BB11-1 TaxID=2996783 RepID=UPI002270B8DA|nr:choice-of-anchor D domain-containing protein [Corallococcus sp. BB11-1]MCY1034626.1 choice-of-anchor D domain-containing protein [Corallococcus sp. BB11-1]
MTGRWSLLGLLSVLLVSGCADRERSSLADGRLTATPGGVDFARVAIFDARESQVTLRNVGRARITVDEAWVEGPEGAYKAEFTHEGPHSLVPGAECTLKVRFAPMAEGGLPAVLVVRSDTRIEPLMRLPLNGAGVDAWARVSPRKLDFGRIEADATKQLGVTLDNPTELPVMVTPKLVGADKDEFVAEAITVNPGERRELPITFTPVRVGKKQIALAVSPCHGCADVTVQVTAEALERAVVAEPEVVDFGAVPVDRDALKASSLRNISTEPVTVNSLMLDGTDASFSHSNTGLPLVLQPGEVRGFEIRYSPGHMGPATDRAVYSVVSKRHPTLAVPLRGFGGASELCVSPLTHDFGEQPLGSKVRVVVNVKNCGTNNAGPLTINTLTWTPDPSGPLQFNHKPLATPYTLPPNGEVNLEVYYEPSREGSAAGSLVMTTNAFSAATVQLDFFGRARAHAPCDLVVTPQVLDYGTVPPGRGAVLGVKLENKGADLCPVKNIRVVNDGGGVFRMPGGDLFGGIIYPGDWFSFQVAFQAPFTGGDFAGELQVEQYNPTTPVLQVPLMAHSQTTCLVASPWYVDFGLARKDCRPAPREVNYLNACTTPVTISNVFIGPGTTDSEFTLLDNPAPPAFQLQPGESFTVGVDYFAQVTGMNLSPLFVDSSDLTVPLLVPLIGESSKKVEKTDNFVQQDVSKVDVLFVVDNTASMVEEHPKLVSAIPSFVDAARNKAVDLNMAVTTTGISAVSGACPGGALGGEAGRFFPADNTRQRILTLATPDVTQVLQQNMQVGQCAQVEQGFEAMRRALTPPLVNNADDPRTALPNDGNLGFLRDSAALVVVFVGDEDDHSPDAVSTYVQWAQQRKGENQPQRATFFAIAPTKTACATAGGAGTRYADAAAQTGGEVLNVCAADYAPLLRQVASKAFSAQDRFPLSEEPDTGTVVVSVNGASTPSGWSYDAASNSVVFSVVPPPGAKVSITYRRACAND